MTLVILAAGMGSRYGGLKQIDPMTEHGEFIIDFSIYDAIQAGFDKVVFIIKKENYQAFAETVGKRVSQHVQTFYAFQELSDLPDGYTVPEGRVKPWGTGHALYAAREYLTEGFAVINSDDFYGRDAFFKAAEHLKNHADGDHYCMVGYRLGNTLSDSGTVSRGQCFVNENGMLDGVTERTEIKRVGENAAYREANGEWVDLPGDTVVSMNFWGMTPSIAPRLAEGFKEFLALRGSELKSEYFIPGAVDGFMKAGLCDVKFYKTDAQWYGVTFTQDKEYVKASIKNMIESGVYPDSLWK
ncbi:MAG: nucleotidyltransferase [Clostridia bacterium]|nr:nucleotidyltransferase [Clostridia bacterium]